MWEAVLNLKTVATAMDTTFFEVGGDSVSAIRLVSIIRAAYPGVAFTVKDVFDYPSLRKMMARLSQLTGSGACDTVEVVSITQTVADEHGESELESLEEMTRYLLKVRRSTSNDVVVCFPGLGWLGGEFEALSNSLNGFSVYISQLRDPTLPIKKVLETICQEILQLKCERVILVGHSMGGLVAMQVRSLLHESGFSGIPLVMVDTHVPIKGRSPMSEMDIRVAMGHVIGSQGSELGSAKQRFATRARTMSAWEASGELGYSLDYDAMVRVGRGKIKVRDMHPERVFALEGADHFSVLRTPHVAKVVSVVRMLVDEVGCVKDEETCRAE
jgi:pimeloyl-ACP methyl ester carboxylesterase